MTEALELDPSCALVLIDLQEGIVTRQLAPHESKDVVARSSELAKAFRAKGMPVVLVTVGWSADIVLAGVATNMGVESTARAAWEHSYSIVFAEDATSSFSTAMHNFSFENIFPKLGLVSDSAAIISTLQG